MKNELQALCDLFIANRDAVKAAFKWDSHYFYPVCANIFTARGVAVEEERLLRCKEIIKEQTGIFSNFRGNVRPALASMLALAEDPDRKMAQATDYYQMLKTEFWGSEYLALAAVLLTDLTDEAGLTEIIHRGKALYNRMKKEHPFLTSSEDSVFAALLAFSPRTDDQLIQDMEACYALLREKFSIGNSLQAVSHVLALSDRTPEGKCGRLMDLFDSLAQAGRKYGRYYELSTLASLAVQDADLAALTADILDADQFLSQQKGYGGFFGIEKKTRLMHAAMLVSDLNLPQNTTNAAAMTGTLAMVIAQEMMMLAVITSSTAATAASTSSGHSH